MAFSYSSGVITQSGTDTDLKGLNGLTGVTVTTTNVQLAADRYDVYVIDSSTQLKITGTLTIEPDIEMLIIEKEPESWGNGAPLVVASGGVLNFGVAKNTAGVTNYSQGVGLQFTNQPANFFARDGMFIASGGTLNWNGGIMRTACTLTVGNGGTCTVNDGTIYNSSTADNYQFRIEAANQTNSDLVNIYRLRYDGMTRPIRIFSTYSFGTLRPILARGQFSAFNSGNNQPITVENFDIANNGAQYDALFGVQHSSGGATMTLQNCSSIPNYDPFVTNATFGYYRVLRQMDVSVVNLAGSGITYSYYGVDTDNGGRGVAPNGDDDTADKIYSGINQTGNFDDNLLVSADRCIGNKVIVLDRRDDNNDGTGTIPIRFISYLDSITLFEPTLIGLNSDTSRVVLLPDTLVSETNKSIVDAYTQLNTSSEIYDRAKSYLVENYAGETDLIVTKEGSQVNINSTNLNINGTASNVFDYSTDITIKSSTFTAGVKGSGTVTVSNGVSLNGGTFESDINYQVGSSTITDVTANNIDFNTAGAYNLVGCTISNVTNSSGGNITLSLDSQSTVTTNGGPNISIQTPPTTINFNSLESGSQLVIYSSGTTTELYRVNSTGTSEQYVDSNPSVNFDFTIQKTGFSPLRQTNLTATNAAATNISGQQILDRAYVASTGLNNTNVTVNTTSKTIDITTATTVQNAYSYLIEAFINESSLRNIQFPATTFGSASFSLDLDYEFTSSTIYNLSRDGFRYTNSGNVKAIYAAILSQGVASGLQAEYVQNQGGTVIDAQNTGNVDQVIKIFGDANNGNFDYRNHLVFKVQGNGYRQVEFDVVQTYGTLEANFYVIGLTTLYIDGLTTGDPSITGVTLTDNTSTPVSWDAGDGVSRNYSLTITDTNNNTGEDVFRHFNYLLSTDGTLNGLDVFQYPELIIDNGAAYETVLGVFRKSTGDSAVGVRVVDGSGNAHPDFTRFQSDNGTYGVVPIFSQGSISNIVSGSRLQIYNVTTSTEIVNQVMTGTSYSVTYLNGNDYTDGDTIRVRLTYQNGTSAKLGFQTSTLVSSTGFSVVASQEDDTVYNSMGVDGATISLFEADYVDTEIDLIVSSNFGTTDLYPWWVYNLHTADGIRYFFGGIFAEDLANFRINTNTIDLFFDTDVSTNVYQNNDSRIYRTDSAYPVKAPTTGGGAIDLVWRNKVLIAETGVSGLTATESSKLNELDKLEGIEKLTKLIPASL